MGEIAPKSQTLKRSQRKPRLYLVNFSALVSSWQVLVPYPSFEPSLVLCAWYVCLFCGRKSGDDIWVLQLWCCCGCCMRAGGKRAGTCIKGFFSCIWTLKIAFFRFLADNFFCRNVRKVLTYNYLWNYHPLITWNEPSFITAQQHATNPANSISRSRKIINRWNRHFLVSLF